MDVVYILGKGSPRNDLELLFSIRSLKKHMKDLGKIYIVGELPSWIHNVVYIPAVDPYEKAWSNALHKIKIACADDRISEDFLLMNDDFYMLKDFYGADFPFYAHKGRDGGCNGRYSYAIHAPYRINKGFFKQLPLDPTQKGDWSPRSFYCNFFKAPPTFTEDFNLNTNHPAVDIHMKSLGMPLISTGSQGIMHDNFLAMLMSYFPDQTEYEVFDLPITEFLQLEK